MHTCSGRETNVIKFDESWSSLYFNLWFPASVSELSNSGTRFVGERRETCPKASRGTVSKNVRLLVEILLKSLPSGVPQEENHSLCVKNVFSESIRYRG